MYICLVLSFLISQSFSPWKLHHNIQIHLEKLRVKDYICITLLYVCLTSADVAHHMKIALSNGGRKERIPSIGLSFMFLATGWDLMLKFSSSAIVSRHPIPCVFCLHLKEDICNTFCASSHRKEVSGIIYRLLLWFGFTFCLYSS